MITFDEVLARVQTLQAEELQLWIARRWVRPERQGQELRFAEIDLARVRLIHDIRHSMAVPPDTVPVVLSLMDQLYSMRRKLRGVATAIETLPPEMQQIILEELRNEDPKPPEPK